MNREQAFRLGAAQQALRAYRLAKGHGDLHWDVIDLVTDLLHLNATLGETYTAEDVARIALGHFEAETQA